MSFRSGISSKLSKVRSGHFQRRRSLVVFCEAGREAASWAANPTYTHDWSACQQLYVTKPPKKGGFVTKYCSSSPILNRRSGNFLTQLRGQPGIKNHARQTIRSDQRNFALFDFADITGTPEESAPIA
jgi:hypothetical protein